LGSTVYGTDGEKIGKVGAVFVDDQSGEPEFATVQTGLFGRKETFVPLQSAELGNGELTVPYGVQQVKDAPNIEVDGGHLSQEEENALYRYYGINADTSTMSGQGQAPYAADPALSEGRPDALAAGMGTTAAADADAAGRHARAGRTKGGTDDAMTRSEERLNVGTESVETGRARLRKYVVTEEVQQTIPVKRERVRVEHEPITESNRDAAMSGDAFQEGEHEVTLHEERPVVSKEEVPVERVRLATETETGQAQVNEQVRKEQIDEELPGEDPRNRRK